jgi:DNA-directed RNA polymerase specialized sigma24 family protein
MAASLRELPRELGDVVRLRLFEDRTMAEIAQALGIGVEGVRHRFRRGAELYRAELRRRLGVDSFPPGTGDKAATAADMHSS